MEWKPGLSAVESVEIDVVPWPWRRGSVGNCSDGTWSAWLSWSYFDDEDTVDLGRYRSMQSAKEAIVAIVEALHEETDYLSGRDDFGSRIAVSADTAFGHSLIPEAGSCCHSPAETA